MKLCALLCSVALLTVFSARSQQLSSGQDTPAHGIMDPASTYFPDASLVDYSFLLSPPAGRFGFVEIDGQGRLKFEDGRIARFWGVCIDQESIVIPKEMIDQVVRVMARSGVNIIRFSAIDSRKGRRGELVENIIDEEALARGISSVVNDDFQDRLDYWIAAAKKRGIYSIVGFRFARRFGPGDGAANADSLEPGGGAAAMFDPRLIQLQKDFIDSLFANHRNPYTGLTYINEPAIAEVELGTDLDLFQRPADWSSMPEPYWSEFNRLWNEWLEGQYHSTGRLRAAWTNTAGLQALGARESLERGTVRLPNMEEAPFDQAILAPYHDPLRSPARRTEAVRFALDLEQKYFDTMSDFCRGRGIRVPLTAGIRVGGIPSSHAASKSLGGISISIQFDPVVSDASGRLSFSNQNPLTETEPGGIAALIARAHWFGALVIVREWSAPWPNEFRFAGPIEVAAAGLLQGADILVCKGYDTKGSLMSVTPNGIQSDPVRWGLFGLAAKMFLEGDIHRAGSTIGIRYSPDDLTTFSSFSPSLYSLAWKYRIMNVSAGDNAETDMTITAGRSHSDEVAGKRIILYTHSPFVEAQKQQVLQERNSLYAKAGYVLPIVFFRSDSFSVRIGASPMWFHARYGFKTSSLRPRGLEPFGPDPSGILSLGFLDSTNQVLGVGSVSTDDAALIADEMMARWNEAEGEIPPAPPSNIGEMVRYPQRGVAVIRAPLFNAVYGALKPGQQYEAGDLRVISQSPVAAVVASSLDGMPLGQSKKISIKMVTVAENSLQSISPSGAGKRATVLDNGGFPVTTKGMSTDRPTSVWIGEKKIAEVFMVNGTWEMVLDLTKNEIDCFCDTPLMKIRLLPDLPVAGVMIGIVGNGGGEPQWTEQQQEFLYPPFARMVRVAFR